MSRRAIIAFVTVSSVSLWMSVLSGLPRGAAQDSAARDEPIRVRLETSRGSARVGETGEVIAIVDASNSAEGPLLLTPTSDGPAIEVVRGRLLRADAEDPRTTPLRFHVPFVARSPGDAVVRVRVDGWSCAALREGAEVRCQVVRAEAAITLTVRGT